MYELMIVVFVLGYACITLEHQLKIDKAAVALVTGILCWTIYVVGKEQIVDLNKVKDHAIALHILVKFQRQMINQLMMN